MSETERRMLSSFTSASGLTVCHCWGKQLEKRAESERERVLGVCHVKPKAAHQKAVSRAWSQNTLTQISCSYNLYSKAPSRGGRSQRVCVRVCCWVRTRRDGGQKP